MFCPNCGNKISDENGISCPTCGCDFRPARDVFDQWVKYLDTHKMPVENRQQVDRKINMKIFIPAIIIYTIFIGFLLTVVGGEKLSFSTDPLDSFKRDLEKNEFKEKEENVFGRVDESSGVYFGFNLNDDYFFYEEESTKYKLYYFDDRVRCDYTTGYIDYTVVYNLKSGISECSSQPASYNVNCGLLEGSVRQNAIDLQDTFDGLIEKLNVDKEDLRGDK